MTEEEARDWVRAHYGVSRETMLARFVDLLTIASDQQNLVSQSTLPSAWSRHIVDSAQLLTEVVDIGGDWIDIGSGAGLPGLVVAILREKPILLVEPRRRRVDFLQLVVDQLGLSNVTIAMSRIEMVMRNRPAAIISARAVSALPELIGSAIHCSDRQTIWLLPKGRTAQSEVAAARRTWQGMFHVKPSLTEAESGIVIARGVATR